MESDSPHGKARQTAAATARPDRPENPRPTPERTAAFMDRIGFPAIALALTTFYLALIFAALWRPDFRTDSRLHAGLSLVAFHTDTFTFHGGVAAAGLAVVSALGHRWLLGVAALPAVLFAVGPAVWCYLPHDPRAVSGDSITVMTANVLGPNRRREALIGELAAADPDVLLVQEYTPLWRTALTAALGDRYPHVYAIPRDDYYGTAVFSKLPFAGADPVRLSLGGLALPCVQAALRIDGRLVTFFIVHLVPPKSVEDFRRQSAQVADLLDAAAAEPGPVVLAGDFNFTRRSRFARSLRGMGLTECHKQAGSSRGTTWPVYGVLRYVPGLRIDHIYLSGELTCVSCRTGTGTGSDHRPVVATIGFSP